MLTLKWYYFYVKIITIVFMLFLLKFVVKAYKTIIISLEKILVLFF